MEYNILSFVEGAAVLNIFKHQEGRVVGLQKSELDYTYYFPTVSSYDEYKVLASRGHRFFKQPPQALKLLKEYNCKHYQPSRTASDRFNRSNVVPYLEIQVDEIDELSKNGIAYRPK